MFMERIQNLKARIALIRKLQELESDNQMGALLKRCRRAILNLELRKLSSLAPNDSVTGSAAAYKAKPANKIKEFNYKFKSPLKYIGGKTRGREFIIPLLAGNREVCSPFIGGGSVEVVLAGNGVRVYGCDTLIQLVNFWNRVLKEPEELYNALIPHYYFFNDFEYEEEEKKEMFYYLIQECLTDKTSLTGAARFYVINKISFNGMTLTGTYGRFECLSEGALEKIKDFRLNNLSVEFLDYRESIRKYRDVFLWLDPPYVGNEHYYGETQSSYKWFDHAELRRLLGDRGRWVMSYGNCKKIRELYRGYRMLKPNWSYGIGGSCYGKELLILSNDVPLPPNVRLDTDGMYYYA